MDLSPKAALTEPARLTILALISQDANSSQRRPFRRGRGPEAMALKDRLTEDLKLAMKSKDQLRMDVIRMVKAAITNKEIELRKDLDDLEMSRVMTVMVKQRREAAEQYQKGHRSDLAEKEMKEIAIIETYLPKALSKDELTQMVETAIQELGSVSMKDLGAVMKSVMGRVGGRPVDGKELSDLVRVRLQS
jgi:uncharacterized protein